MRKNIEELWSNWSLYAWSKNQLESSKWVEYSEKHHPESYEYQNKIGSSIPNIFFSPVPISCPWLYSSSIFYEIVSPNYQKYPIYYLYKKNHKKRLISIFKHFSDSIKWTRNTFLRDFLESSSILYLSENCVFDTSHIYSRDNISKHFWKHNKYHYIKISNNHEPKYSLYNPTNHCIPLFLFDMVVYIINFFFLREFLFFRHTIILWD